VARASFSWAESAWGSRASILFPVALAAMTALLSFVTPPALGFCTGLRDAFANDLRLFVGIPEFTIGLDILHRSGWVDVKIVAAELFVEAECGLVATEVEQAVKGSLDVACVGDGRAQDGFSTTGVYSLTAFGLSRGGLMRDHRWIRACWRSRSWLTLPGCLSPCGLLSGVLDGLVEASLEERQGWQFSEVFTDADGFGIQLEEFHLFGIGCGTED
jgi:hypothetical protein